MVAGKASRYNMYNIIGLGQIIYNEFKRQQIYYSFLVMILITLIIFLKYYQPTSTTNCGLKMLYSYYLYLVKYSKDRSVL